MAEEAYLLDTSIASIAGYEGDPRHASVREWLNGLQDDVVYISAVTIAECEYGLSLNPMDAHSQQEIRRAIRTFQVMPVDRHTAEVYGPARTFVLFNVAGASGFLLSNEMSGAPTIGASGAIFGLLAALIVYGRKRGSSVMTQQLWQWAIILGIFGFIVPSVNNWAHGGGFAGGWIAAHLMGFGDEYRESTGVLLGALALIAVTAVGIGLSFYNVTGILLAE